MKSHNQHIMRLLSPIPMLLAGCLPFSASQADTLSAEDSAYYLCSGCHGPDNTRVDFMSPNIIGQKKDYLLNQMKRFQTGQRKHPYMSSGVLSNFTPEELDQLATYYANARQK
ncbi:MAG: hypothetical protein RIQ52_1978 [Pseudomonadota bacterium]|jgi:cytochrome c553